MAEQGLSNYAIAERLGVDEASVRRGLKAAGYKRYLIPTDLEERFDFTLDKPIFADGNWMITADYHIPLYDPKLVNEMIEKARENELKNLCIAGDFFNHDALSRFEPKQDEAHLDREWAEAVAVMRTLTESFDRITFLWGNHDARLHKALGFKIQFREAMRMVFGELGDSLAKVEFTNLDHMWIEHDEKLWYICHPLNYTRTPLSTARVLAAKVGANVITAHSHHCAVGYATDGQTVVAEIGGLFDADKTSYLQRSTTFPRWQQGYAWLQDGRLNVVSPGWSLS